MSDDSDFFGDVFDDPDDDPLLGGEGNASEDPDGSSSDPEGPPSWMEDDHERMNGEAASSDPDKETSPTQKRIVVDQTGPEGEGIDALNRAVGQGWRLVHLSLARPDGKQAPSEWEAHRFVATLEQENPQSLFDFDTTG